MGCGTGRRDPLLPLAQLGRRRCRGRTDPRRWGLPHPHGFRDGEGSDPGYLGAFETAFPKADYHIDTVVESGSAVAVEGTYHATHQGPLPLPDGTVLEATGREVSAPFVTMFSVEDGSITSHRPYWDLAGLMAQLAG